MWARGKNGEREKRKGKREGKERGKRKTGRGMGSFEASGVSVIIFFSSPLHEFFQMSTSVRKIVIYGMASKCFLPK